MCGGGGGGGGRHKKGYNVNWDFQSGLCLVSLMYLFYSLTERVQYRLLRVKES